MTTPPVRPSWPGRSSPRKRRRSRSADLINRATVRDLASDEVAAYDAPFPDDTYKAGARIWPSLVPTTPDGPESAENREAWKVLMGCDQTIALLFQ